MNKAEFTNAAATFGQALNKAVEERLKNELFPGEMHDSFTDWARRAMLQESPGTIGCDAPTVLELNDLLSDSVIAATGISLYHASFLFNSLQTKTPVELGMDIAEYNEMLQAVSSMALVWNEKVNPLKKEVELQVADQLRQEAEAHAAAEMEKRAALTEGLSFDEALGRLQAGKKVKRPEWPADDHLVLADGGSVEGVAGRSGVSNGVWMNEAVNQLSAVETHAPWIGKPSDVDADDWMVVPE